ncbi:hypothetical protein HHI36_001850 [Cryptolaemus montrouzieri]|uniref:Uncharacterized protein n=1 Tax=Cryptolaemus montrouzieri TaxID=559131 RepID=A0ABD2P9M0_9CUCU
MECNLKNVTQNTNENFGDVQSTNITSNNCKESNVFTKKDVTKIVKEFVEEELGSPLKRYYFKGLASRIKRDGKESYWIKLIIMELTNLEKKLNSTFINIYFEHLGLYPGFEELCDLIENKYKSNIDIKYQFKFVLNSHFIISN